VSHVIRLRFRPVGHARQHTPIRDGVEETSDEGKKRKKRKEGKKRKVRENEKKEEKLTNCETKILTMTKGERCGKRFGKNIGCHITRRKPNCSERSVIDVLTNKMVADIDVFGSGGDGICICNGTSTLIVAEDRERLRQWEFRE